MAEFHKQLLENLHYDPETGVFTWIKQKSYSTQIGSIAGTKLKDGYIRIKFNSRPYFAHRLAWFYIYKEFPIKGLDHVNRNREDNRLSNLREASISENNQNRNSKGYYWYGARNMWRSKIVVYDKVIYLGFFKTEEEARAAYLKAKREYHLTWSENV